MSTLRDYAKMQREYRAELDELKAGQILAAYGLTAGFLVWCGLCFWLVWSAAP